MPIRHARPVRSSLPEPPEGVRAAMCVLASGSAGNCSVLVVPEDTGRRRVCLIDAGLSPLRTRRLLAGLGIEPWEVDDVLLTHLDGDHLHPGWNTAPGWRATFRLHRRHRGRAERGGLLARPCEPFESAFTLGDGVIVEPLLLSHDSLGVATFRFGFGADAALGFATDLGRATPALVAHMRGVGTLAIESNYCPIMQAASDRPAFLKRRIMGGHGHLSNQEALDAARAIVPQDHVVLLHLSRQCNRPEVAAALHAGEPYALTLTRQDAPTGWIWIRRSERPVARDRSYVDAGPCGTMSLFERPGASGAGV